MKQNIFEVATAPMRRVILQLVAGGAMPVHFRPRACQGGSANVEVLAGSEPYGRKNQPGAFLPAAPHKQDHSIQKTQEDDFRPLYQLLIHLNTHQK